MAESEARDVEHFDTREHTLSVEDVHQIYVDAGFPRSIRSIQRWCENGHLKAVKYPTEAGAQYYIDPDSAQQRLEEIRQVQAATGNDRQRHDVDRRDMSSSQLSDEGDDIDDATSDDGQRLSFNDARRRAESGAQDQGIQYRSSERPSTTGDDTASMSRHDGLEKELIGMVTGQQKHIREQEKIIEQKNQTIDKLLTARVRDTEFFMGAISKLRETLGLQAGSSEEPEQPKQAKEQMSIPMQHEVRGDKGEVDVSGNSV